MTAELLSRLSSLSRAKHSDLSVAEEAADEIRRLRSEVSRLTELLGDVAVCRTCGQCVEPSDSACECTKNGHPELQEIAPYDWEQDQYIEQLLDTLSSRFRPISECKYGVNLLAYTTSGRPVILQKSISSAGSDIFIGIQPTASECQDDYPDIAMPLPEPEAP